MKIWNYKDNGYNNKDIVDLVEDEAEPYVRSRRQLIRCVGSIVAKHTLGQKPRVDSHIHTGSPDNVIK